MDFPHNVMAPISNPFRKQYRHESADLFVTTVSMHLFQRSILCHKHRANVSGSHAVSVTMSTSSRFHPPLETAAVVLLARQETTRSANRSICHVLLSAVMVPLSLDTEVLLQPSTVDLGVAVKYKLGFEFMHVDQVNPGPPYHRSFRNGAEILRRAVLTVQQPPRPTSSQ
jgi:hypothetical protein